MKRVALLVLTGTILLAGCGEGPNETAASEQAIKTQGLEQSPEPCFHSTEVAGFSFDWSLDIMAPKEKATDQTKAELANEYAERAKELSWAVPDGSDCIGYRESLVFTREALILAQALDEGSATDDMYDSAADAGEDFLKVMKLDEQGYEPERSKFARTPEEAEERIPGY